MKKLFPLLLLVITACNAPTTDTTEVSTTETTTASNNTAAEFKTYMDQKEVTELGIKDGKITFYTVADGEGLVAESTTYYSDEEKTMPCLTKIIYKTGGFANVYWLHEQSMWVDKDDYSYIFKNGNLIATLSNNAPTEVADSDKAAASEVATMASAIVTKLMSE